MRIGIRIGMCIGTGTGVGMGIAIVVVGSGPILMVSLSNVNQVRLVINARIFPWNAPKHLHQGIH